MKIQAVHIEQTQDGLSKTVTIALLTNTLIFDLKTGFSSKGAMPTLAWACVTPSRHAYTSVSMALTGVRILAAHQLGAGSLSENSGVGPRASVFSPDKDGEAGDVGFIVDTAGCSQADNSGLIRQWLRSS